MSVRVVLFATLRKKYGVKEVVVRCDGTLKSLVENISKTLGDSFFTEIYDKNRGKVRDNLILMINGRNIKDLKGEVTLRNNDVIAVFPPLAGG